MLDLLPGFGRRTLVMGVLNATNDSFSGDGYGDDVAALVRRGLDMARDGADVLDVGAASSRPGHADVPLAQELSRARSAVAGLRAAVEVPISIDSTRAEVVAACLEAGARIVNDVSCLADDRLAALAAGRDAALIVVHTLPSARARAERDAAPAGIVGVVRAELAAAVDRAEAAGLPRERVLVDPGLGFAKIAAESFALVRELGEIRSLAPVVVGSSRKGHLGAVTGRHVDERIVAGAAAASAAILAGADVVRVHDVAEAIDAVRTADAIRRGVVTRTAYVGLGANVGDARATLRRAIDEMSRLGRVTGVSGLWRTEPMYRTDQPPFLNAVASLETSLACPAVLVSELKRIERELGRVPRERYGPRELDLDLLLYRGSSAPERDGTVRVPHERLAERRFVLGPLAELAPDEVEPRSGRTVRELLAAVAGQDAERMEGPEWMTASS
ncbi:MAG: dihydropteroate synthase [Chloroflexota bacterium]|nr:dihydropteroate synthase [Chloroflexota bacterium]